MTPFRIIVVAVCAAAVTALPAGSAETRDVEVRTALDRTAIWVGDRVAYTITLACGKGVDVLTDDLSKDKLRVEGLDVIGSDSERTTDAGDRTTYAFRYVLTTYRADATQLTIAPLTVRYYVKRPGQRLEDAAPAGEVVVPGSAIALRSALPDGQQGYEARAGRPPRPRPLRYALLWPAGIALVVISIVPVGIAAVGAVRRQRPRERRRSIRQVRSDERVTLETIRALDVSKPVERRDAYFRLNALVRGHLEQIGVEAAGLTPEEIETALSTRETRLPASLVSRLLAACDRARYAPPDALPSSDDCREAIHQSEQLLAP
jgi:hypothetical protein